MFRKVKPGRISVSFAPSVAILALVAGLVAPWNSLNPGFAVGETITIGDLSVPTNSGPTSIQVTLGGFDEAKEYIAVVGVTSGTVSVTTTSGITTSPSYASPTTASSEISFYGLYPNIAAAIATLRYQSPAAGSTPTLRVELTERAPADRTIYYWSEGQRYYEYISSANPIS